MKSTQLSFARTIGYGVGNTGLALVNIVVQTWLLYFLAPPVGRTLIPASIVGTVWLVGRLVDAAADPLVSAWTDRARGPAGRRMPFLLATSIPLAAVCLLLFVDAVYVGPLPLRVVILGVLLGLFYILFTAYAVPFNSLIADLGRDGPGRVRLATSSALFNLVGTAGAAVAAGLLIQAFASRPMPEGVAAGAGGGAGGDAAAGAATGSGAAVDGAAGAAADALPGVFDSGAFPPAVAVLMVVAAVTFLVTPLALWKFRRAGDAPTSLKFISSMKAALTNRAFRIYLIGINTFWGGFIMINVSIPYYVTVLMGQDEGFTSVALGASLGTALVVFPLVNLATRRFGNKRTVIASAAIMAVALVLIWFIPSVEGGEAIFGTAVMVFAGIGLSGLLVLPNAMIGDLAEFRLPDGSNPGEAIYYGLQGLLQKGVIGVVTLASGLLFDLFGNTPTDPLGIRLTGPIGAAFAVASVIIMLRYPDDRGGLDPTVLGRAAAPGSDAGGAADAAGSGTERGTAGGARHGE